MVSYRSLEMDTACIHQTQTVLFTLHASQTAKQSIVFGPVRPCVCIQAVVQKLLIRN